MSGERIAILGPGGVGGFLAGALEHAGQPVTVVAREQTAAMLASRGLSVESVRLGSFQVRPRSVSQLTEAVDFLIVATKAGGLGPALERVTADPELVVPLLNGLDHLSVLRTRFGSRVAAASIRIEADRPRAGHVVHTSPFLGVDLACADRARRPQLERLAGVLRTAQVPVAVLDSEPQVMWSKLVRLNALACTTSASNLLLGQIRADPQWSEALRGAVEEGAAVARAEGADVRAERAMAELEAAHPTLGSSMQRDIAAGRPPELDAIAGSVLRAAARHAVPCPTIERLAARVAERSGLPAPGPARRSPAGQ